MDLLTVANRLIALQIESDIHADKVLECGFVSDSALDPVGGEAKLMYLALECLGATPAWLKEERYILDAWMNLRDDHGISTERERQKFTAAFLQLAIDELAKDPP